MEGAPGSPNSSQEIPHKYRIMVSVGERSSETWRDLDTKAKELDAEAVHWGGEPNDLEKLDQRHDGKFTYVVSSLNSRNKNSESFGPCTGVAAIGTDRQSGLNISFLTHETPFSASTDAFKIDLTAVLDEMKNAAVPGTIDVIIFGGNVYEEKKWFGGTKIDEREFQKVIAGLTDTVQQTLHVEPRIFGAVVDDADARRDGSSGITDVVLDTENRRLYMHRTEGKAASDSFDRPASAVVGKNKK